MAKRNPDQRAAALADELNTIRISEIGEWISRHLASGTPPDTIAFVLEAHIFAVVMQLAREFPREKRHGVIDCMLKNVSHTALTHPDVRSHS